MSCTDVCDSAAVTALMQQVEERFGGLDVLVNNVGDFLGIIKPFAACTDEDLERLYAVNLKHIFTVTRAAIPLLQARGKGGSIISVSSIEAFRGIPMVTTYCAFKHAITGFTRSLALELGPDGIRVNAIAPETTETAQVRPSELIAPEHQAHTRRWIPLERFGTPEDAAGCALFLAPVDQCAGGDRQRLQFLAGPRSDNGAGAVMRRRHALVFSPQDRQSSAPVAGGAAGAGRAGALAATLAAMAQ